MNFTTVCHP